MAPPNIQLGGNDEKMRLYWDLDVSGAYTSFNLYWSMDSGMAGEAQVAVNIPNTPDIYYSKRHVNFFFHRSDLFFIIALNNPVLNIPLLYPSFFSASQ